jgi:autotransporter-associated beta strand protein
MGTLTVTTNTFLSIYGSARGQFLAATLAGPGTVLYQGEYVRDHFSFGVTTNFTGTIIFGGNAGGANLNTGGMCDDSASGFPNANVVFSTTNNVTAGIDCSVGGNVLPFGSLSGGDNTALLSSTYANGGVNTMYAIGSLNTSTTFGGQITDGGTGIRKVGTGTLTLTNNILSWGGQTVVSNGTLVFIPLGNNPVLGFTPLTNNFLVCSNFTVVSPGILDVSHIGGTLYVGANVASQQSLFGNGTINGSVLVTNNLVAPAWRAGPNAGSFPGNLTVTNNMTVNFGSTIQMNISATNATPYSSLTVGGTLTINSARLTVLTNDSAQFAGGSSNVFYFFDSPAGVTHAVAYNTIGSAGTTGITNISVQVVPNGRWVTNLALDGSMALVMSNTASTNSLLSSLVVTPAGALSPAFNSNTLSYTAVEAYLNSPVTVTPVNWDTTATNQVIYLGATQTVASASPSTSLALNTNSLVPNTVTVKVTAQDGVTVHNYTVNVVRNPARTPPLACPGHQWQHDDDELAVV